MTGNADLRLAAVLAVGCAILALVLPLDVLRLAFALPLALLLPGYAIASAAFVGRPLGRPQLLLAAIGMSLMVLTLGSLPLNYVPGGIDGVSWALLLVAVVLVAGGVAARRRGRHGEPVAHASPGLPRMRPARTAAAGAGALAVVAALVLAFVDVPAGDALGYSELWMLPREDGAGVTVGLTSQEQEPLDYRLRVAFGGADAAVERQLSLQPGEEETLSIPTPPSARGNPVPVNATLYREDDPGDIYRRVAGYVPGPGAPE